MIADKIWSEFKRLYMEGLADDYKPHDDVLRAALEAVAPMLIARGMREAAQDYRAWLVSSEDGVSFDQLMQARAQELEQK